MGTRQSSLVGRCWGSRMLSPWRCHASVRESYRPFLFSPLSSCSSGSPPFCTAASTTLTCPRRLFPHLCTITTGVCVWSPVQLPQENTDCSYCVFDSLFLTFTLIQLFMFLPAGQTVNLHPLFCALIQWPTSLWWGTRNMYVLTRVCASIYVSTACTVCISASFFLKCTFRCWHSARPIRCLCSWRCLILRSIRSWACSWSRQPVSPGMESKLPPLLAL